jgi:hypothetical protein
MHVKMAKSWQYKRRQAILINIKRGKKFVEFVKFNIFKSNAIRQTKSTITQHMDGSLCVRKVSKTNSHLLSSYGYDTCLNSSRS